SLRASWSPRLAASTTASSSNSGASVSTGGCATPAPWAAPESAVSDRPPLENRQGYALRTRENGIPRQRLMRSIVPVGRRRRPEPDSGRVGGRHQVRDEEGVVAGDDGLDRGDSVA